MLKSLTGQAVALAGVSVAIVSATGADAASMSYSDTFQVDTYQDATYGPSITLIYDQFELAGQKLAGVSLRVDAALYSDEGTPIEATVTLDGTQIFTQSTSDSVFSDVTYSVGGDPALPFALEFFEGTGSFDVVVSVSGGGKFESLNTASTGITLTYEYEPVDVPLPASLPLALAGIGALGWMRRLKADA